MGARREPAPRRDPARAVGRALTPQDLGDARDPAPPPVGRVPLVAGVVGHLRPLPQRRLASGVRSFGTRAREPHRSDRRGPRRTDVDARGTSATGRREARLEGSSGTNDGELGFDAETRRLQRRALLRSQQRPQRTLHSPTGVAQARPSDRIPGSDAGGHPSIPWRLWAGDEGGPLAMVGWFLGGESTEGVRSPRRSGAPR